MATLQEAVAALTALEDEGRALRSERAELSDRLGQINARLSDLNCQGFYEAHDAVVEAAKALHS